MKKLTKPAQVVRDVPHPPVRPALLRRKPRRQDPRAARATKALKDPVEGPEGAEPRHARPGPKRNVDGGGGHEAPRQHEARRGAGAEDARDELGHAIGDREEGGEGADLCFYFILFYYYYYLDRGRGRTE